MATQIKWKEIVIEHIDSIALLVTAFIAVVLAHLGKIPAESTNTVLLLILCFLAFHHFRRSLKIEKMHEQIGEINENIRKIKDNTEIHEEMGIERILETRREISPEKLHSEIKNATNVFIASRYLKSFANENARDALKKCLLNNGLVRILIYSPRGPHLDVILERDFTSQKAEIQICQTINHLRKFKEDLPPELKEQYLFSWGEISGNDTQRLIGFLKNRFGIEWAEKGKIEIMNSGETIKLFFGSNYLHLKIINDTKVTLKIDDDRSDEFIVKVENGKKNIYKELFQFKILKGHIFYTSIVGVSNRIYATSYLNNLEGDDCPMIVCIPIAKNVTGGLYQKFSKEFETLWGKGLSEDEMKAGEDSIEDLCSGFRKSTNNNTK